MKTLNLRFGISEADNKQQKIIYVYQDRFVVRVHCSSVASAGNMVDLFINAVYNVTREDFDTYTKVTPTNLIVGETGGWCKPGYTVTLLNIALQGTRTVTAYEWIDFPTLEPLMSNVNLDAAVIEEKRDEWAEGFKSISVTNIGINDGVVVASNNANFVDGTQTTYTVQMNTDGYPFDQNHYDVNGNYEEHTPVLVPPVYDVPTTALPPVPTTLAPVPNPTEVPRPTEVPNPTVAPNPTTTLAPAPTTPKVPNPIVGEALNGLSVRIGVDESESRYRRRIYVLENRVVVQFHPGDIVEIAAQMVNMYVNSVYELIREEHDGYTTLIAGAYLANETGGWCNDQQTAELMTGMLQTLFEDNTLTIGVYEFVPFSTLSVLMGYVGLTNEVIDAKKLEWLKDFHSISVVKKDNEIADVYASSSDDYVSGNVKVYTNQEINSDGSEFDMNQYDPNHATKELSTIGIRVVININRELTSDDEEIMKKGLVLALSRKNIVITADEITVIMSNRRLRQLQNQRSVEFIISSYEYTSAELRQVSEDIVSDGSLEENLSSPDYEIENLSVFTYVKPGQDSGNMIKVSSLIGLIIALLL